MGVVGAFTLRPCQHSVSLLPRHRLPLSAEDCDATESLLHEGEGKIDGLFDESGYLIGLCEEHAEVVLSEAIEGRVCTGALCAKINPDSRVSAARPNVGRRFVGSRLYCDNCFQLREESGVTPAKPVRVPKTLFSAEGSVSPLTETGSTPGSGGFLTGALQARFMRRVGAELQRAGGGARRQTVEPKSASEVVGEIVLGSDDDTTVVGGGGAPGAGGAACAAVRGDDDIRVRLDHLMDLHEAASSRADEFQKSQLRMMDVVGTLTSRMGALVGADAGSPTRVQQAVPAAAEASIDGVMRARELSETVMGAVRGKPPPDDPSLSPIKRLDAQMAPSDSDASVHQSPKQMTMRSSTVVQRVI